MCSNAIKFTPEGGSVDIFGECLEAKPHKNAHSRKLRLKSGEIVQIRPAGTLKVSIADTGVGLSSDQLVRIFEEGLQFNAHDLQGGKGSGFGLSFSKGIVEMHEGTLCASSGGLSQGTTLTLTLQLYFAPTTYSGQPFDNPSSDDTTNWVESTSSVPVNSTPTSLKILVVDDAVSNRKLLCKLLERNGHICEQAEDGKVAVEMVTESSKAEAGYDTILLGTRW